MRNLNFVLCVTPPSPLHPSRSPAVGDAGPGHGPHEPGRRPEILRILRRVKDTPHRLLVRRGRGGQGSDGASCARLNIVF